MRFHPSVVLFVVLSVVAAGGPARGQEGPPPPPRDGGPRAEERQMERRGPEGEAPREWRPVGRREGGGPAVDSREPERREVSRHLEASRAEWKELVANGKEAEAREVEQRIAKLERRLEALRAPDRDTDRRPETRSGPARGDDMPKAERIEHVRIAIEHLHAAGLHDVAERLTRELKEREHRDRERMERGGEERGDARRSGPGPGPMRDGPRDRAWDGGRGGSSGPRFVGPVPPAVQEQLNDLRRQLEELRRRVERGARE